MEGWSEGSDEGEGGKREEGVKGEEVEEKERVPLTLCSVEIINSTFL